MSNYVDIEVKEMTDDVNVDIDLNNVKLTWGDVLIDINETARDILTLKTTVVAMYQNVKDKIDEDTTKQLAGLSLSCDDLIRLAGGMKNTCGKEDIEINEDTMEEYLKIVEAVGKLSEALATLSKDYVMSILPKIVSGEEEILDNMKAELGKLDDK